VTATVDCLPLIVASILSKKLAAGLDALVLDIKHGNGAVLPEPERGRELARAMVATAAEAGLPLRALLTDMSEPLARSAGNALELREAIAMLRTGKADARLLEVTLALGAEVMVLADSRAMRTRRAQLSVLRLLAGPLPRVWRAWSRAWADLWTSSIVRTSTLRRRRSSWMRRRPRQDGCWELTRGRSASRWSRWAAAARRTTTQSIPA
jgi:hypothetical protein